MAPTGSEDERMADAVADADEAAAEAQVAEADTPEPSASAATPASATSAASGASSVGGDSTEEEEEEDDDNDNSSDNDDDDDGSDNDESKDEDSSDGDDDDDNSSSGSNEDDDDDDDGDEAEPMEVEAVPTEDQDEEDDDDEDDGSSSAGPIGKAQPSKPKSAAAEAVPPQPAAVAAAAVAGSEEQPRRKMTPKMRIKLSLKAKAAAAAAEHFPPPPAGRNDVAPAGSDGKEVSAAANNTDKPKATTVNDDDDVVMAEAHVGGEDDNNEEEEEVIATAEVVEEISSAADGRAKTSSAVSTANKSNNSFPAAPNSVGKLIEKNPLHKPSRQRAPPPSLSRPQSKNPQLAYTSTSGQGGGYHTRAMRLPSILSPGMLAVPNHSNIVGTAVCDTDAYKMLHGKHDGSTSKASEGASGAGSGGGGVDANHDDPYEKYVTSDSVFTHYMGAQGYTAESRSSNPHRGSSIQRTVGDMFDNDVMSSINFPNLLPDYLRSRKAPKKSIGMTKLTPEKESEGGSPEKSTPAKDSQADTSGTAAATSTSSDATAQSKSETPTKSETPKKIETSAKSETPKKVEGSPAKVRMDAIDMLKSTLTSVLEKRKAEKSSIAVQQGAAKRFRPLQFQDMVPVSLTFPYPEEYTKARIEYARKVKEREDAIAQDQVASQSAADIMENYNREKAKWEEKLTQWEKDKAEHKEKVAAWEKDQAERKERLTQWEKGRAEVEAAAAALAKKSSPDKDTSKSESENKEEKEAGEGPTDTKDAPSTSDAAATAATDPTAVPKADATNNAGTTGNGDKPAEEVPVLGPPRPATPVQPKEPVLPPLPAPVSIPPIPVSPSPPRWDNNEAKGIERPSPETLKFYATNLAHLDPATYLSTVPTPRARYVGLSSNSIADANFVGPAAHGIAGIGLGLGSGLSTAYTGASGGQGGGGLHSSSYYEGLKRFADHMGYSDVSKVSPAKKKSSISNSSSPTTDSAAKEKSKDGKPKLPKITLKMPSLPPGVKGEGISSSELKTMFETGGQDAEDMRVTIVKATIYAARVGKAAGDKFVGSDDKVYNGVGKAFSNFAGVKPCERCRKSKQGALMCRVRRKHKDEDYDGGKSADELQQYFKAELKTLIRKEPST